jgi:hypothetical protein
MKHYGFNKEVAVLFCDRILSEVEVRLSAVPPRYLSDWVVLEFFHMCRMEELYLLEIFNPPEMNVERIFAWIFKVEGNSIPAASLPSSP